MNARALATACLLLALASLACHHDPSIPSSTPSPAPSPAPQLDAAAPVDASPVVPDAPADAPTPSPDATARADAARPIPLLDAPPRPDDTTRIRLTWVLYPTVMRGGTPARRIELVARAGAVARRFATEQSYSGLMYIPQMQPCSDISSRTPAVLYMNGAGNTVYSVTRESDRLTLSVEESADGLCEPGPCPVTRTTLARIPVPPGVTFEQRFHVIDEGGKSEHDEVCPP